MSLAEPGTYLGRVVEGVVGTAKTGNPQCVITWAITHIQDGAGWRELNPGLERRMYWSLAGGAVDYTWRKLEALGFNGDFGEAMGFSDAARLEGVNITCKHGTRDGQLKEDWELANWGGTEVERASGDIIRQLNMQWKAKGKGKTAKPAPVPTTKAPVNLLNSTSPKAPPPPPAKTATGSPAPCTRDEAWAALTSKHEGTPEDVLSDWTRLIEEACPNKSEADFTTADWGRVRELAGIPF
jgi:hypothetical protein